MPEPGFWIDSKTFITYKELDDDVVQSFIKPIGGFIFPADLFALKKLPSVPFYVRDWLPKRGKSMIYAPPKTGKSWLCLQLARCVGSGQEFLGTPTTQGTVLYVQLELGEEVLQDRLKKTGHSYENVFVGTTFSMKLDSESGKSQLWRAMEAVEADLLIIDPLYKAILGDENESNDMMKVLDFLDSVIEGFRCSILVMHHSGKDQSKRGRGSSVFEDWVDSYLSMKKVSKDGEPLRVRIKPVYYRHAPIPEDSIEIELDDNCEFLLVDGHKTVKQQVAEYAKGKEVVTPKELFAQEIGTNTSVHNALRELVEEGVLQKTGRGEYRCVE